MTISQPVVLLPLAKLFISLLCRGASAEDTDKNLYTPIMTAAVNGNFDAFLALRDRGARLNKLDRDGKSINCLVVESNHTPILEVI